MDSYQALTKRKQFLISNLMLSQSLNILPTQELILINVGLKYKILMKPTQISYQMMVQPHTISR